MGFWDGIYERSEETKKPERDGARSLIRYADYDSGRRRLVPTESTYARKPFLKLEQLYFSDGLIFNAINTWVELICAPGFNIVAHNEKARQHIEKWLKQIEFEDEILPKIVQHMGIYGNSYNEIVFNTAGTKIVDMSDPLDPKTIDFKRDPKTNQILLDSYGKPKGYVQRIDLNKPKAVTTDRMAHFKLYTIGSSQLGIGFIEPVWWAALGKRTLDEKIAQQEFRRANPFVYVSVGDKDHPPSAEEINDLHNVFKDITYKTDFVGPYWHKVQFLQTDPASSSLAAVRYFEDDVITGVGLPKAVVTGIGENENRAVLDTLIAVTQRKVSRIQKSISNIMENKVFKKIAELEGFTETPRMVWNEFSPESLTGKIDRMVKEVQVGLLVPDDELQGVVRRWEKLPVVVTTREELKEGEKNTTTERPKKG